MGISEADLAFIAALGELPRRVCDLGDQDLHCNNDAVFDGLGVKAPRRGKSADFWKAIGSDYLSLDVVGQARRFDLNVKSIPFWWRKFDLVTNCGDTEHIINQANCFRVIHDLTKVGGTMYHCLPIAGYAAHGFFLYNMKFFRALMTANHYELLASLATASDTTGDPHPGPDEFGNLDRWRALYKSCDTGFRIALRKTSARSFRYPLDLPQ